MADEHNHNDNPNPHNGGMTMARAAAFPDSPTLMEALRDPVVLEAHKQTMVRLLRECRLREREASQEAIEAEVGEEAGEEAREEVMREFNPRVLCMAYLVVFHPPSEFATVLFEREPGSQERLEAVQVLGREVLERYEALTAHLAARNDDVTSLPEDLTRGFVGLVAEYKAALLAWQAPQLLRLQRRLRIALLGLYRARACVAPDAPEALLQEMTVQIERLRTRALVLPGGAERLEAIDAELGVMEAEGALNQSSSDNTNDDMATWGHPALAPTRVGVLRLVLGETVTVEDLERDPRVQKVRAAMRAAPSLVEALRAGLVRLVHATLDDDPAPLARIAEIFSSFNDNDDNADLLLLLLLRRVNDECLAPLEERFRAHAVAVVVADPNNNNVAEEGGLEATCERLIRLQVACANRRLAATAPILRRHGVAYLRGQMEDSLLLAAAGGEALPRTRAWLLEHEADTTTVSDAVLAGFVAALALPLAEIPETLMAVEYEGGWLPRWRAELEFLVPVGASLALLLMSGGAVPEALGRWAAAEASDDDDEEVRRLVLATPPPEPTQALFRRHALLFVRARVLDPQRMGEGTERVPTPLAPRLRALADEVRRVALVHADAHGGLYARLCLGI